MDYYLENTKVFKALGDPKRAMIVDMLSCGELCACKILEKFEMSQSTLSHHMKLLCECGLVKGRNEGKWTYYSLDADAIGKTKQFFCAITSDKENCICKENSCKGCCSSDNCCGQPQEKKPINIDFLYLDTTVCGRCRDTETGLDEAVASVAVVLSAAGYEVKVNKVNVSTRELAIQYQFVSSPTIRVNGNDIAVELRETVCEDCGELCGDTVNCRVWVYNGVEYNAPPKELIVDAILREVYNAKQGETQRAAYQFPENLETYFVAKTRKDAAGDTE